MPFTPSGRRAYVANTGAGSVTPINTVTGQALRAIKVGESPIGIVIAHRGRTAYVINFVSQTVTPIPIKTDTAGLPIKAGHGPGAAAFSPDGKTLYVADYGFPRNAPAKPGHYVTPVRTAAGTPGTAIKVGTYPIAIIIVPARK